MALAASDPEREKSIFSPEDWRHIISITTAAGGRASVAMRGGACPDWAGHPVAEYRYLRRSVITLRRRESIIQFVLLFTRPGDFYRWRGDRHIRWCSFLCAYKEAGEKYNMKKIAISIILPIPYFYATSPWIGNTSSTSKIRKNKGKDNSHIQLYRSFSFRRDAAFVTNYSLFRFVGGAFSTSFEIQG